MPSSAKILATTPLLIRKWNPFPTSGLTIDAKEHAYFLKKIIDPSRHPFVDGIGNDRNDELKRQREHVRR
jgi:hypothetical protein